MLNVAPYIDHTILKPGTVSTEVQQLCSEAVNFGFAAVCIPPPFVRKAHQLLKDSEVKVATVIGFPFGYSVAKAKLAEVEQALDDGADELDVVINISAAKSASWNYLESEIRLLLKPIREAGRVIKVITESGILSDEEILKCCNIYGSAGVDFVKTSTGYAETGATIHAVQLMRANLPSDTRIKASGGIRTYEAAVQYINAGADRIGCSAGVMIMKQQASHQ